MSTSGTFLFSSPQSEQIIRDAYERIGITISLIDGNDVISAQRSINFILSSWINNGLNLWTVKQGMLGLTNNQASYPLPSTCIDWLEATLRQSQRDLGGTAYTSAGGIAQYAFDGNPNTACTQTAPNGNISYGWGQSRYSVSQVGIQSNVTDVYTLVCEYSYDNTNWIQALSLLPQTYNQSNLLWFPVPVPISANWFRVRETGGATLDIQELYFNTTIQDIFMTRISRSEYMELSQKFQQGQPTQYYIDRQISPTAYIWQVPTQNYNNIYFTYIEEMQDIGSMQNVADIPSRFLEALCSRLAHVLGLKKNIDLNKVQILGQIADAAYAVAANEDRERVPLRVYGDYSTGYLSV